MRTALTALATLLLASTPAAAAATLTPDQTYSIPVGAITDLGALPTLGGLGYDFAHLLGQ
ncbi:hypothetical protein ACFYST_28745 [Kitasatospora sp. NPDC004614]|uniref:hypothetical protein n=1 Tax=unclassified Kitasatospora TaxID=2633591 RepID=UPI0036A3359B